MVATRPQPPSASADAAAAEALSEAALYLLEPAVPPLPKRPRQDAEQEGAAGGVEVHDRAAQDLKALNLCIFLLLQDTECRQQSKPAERRFMLQRKLALAPPHVYIYWEIVEKSLEDETIGIELGEASPHHREQIGALVLAQKMVLGSVAVTIIPHSRPRTTQDRLTVNLSSLDAVHRQSLSLSFRKLAEEKNKGKGILARLPGVARMSRRWYM